MNVKNNLPSVFLTVGVGLLILLPRGSARGDDYVANISTYAEYTEPYYVWTGTEQAWASASAGAQDVSVGDWESARVFCSADAQIMLSYDESDEREQWGWAIATIVWSWSGPPGTAPPGWLHWNQDDDGRAEANGSYDDHGGTLTVSSSASSNASADSPNDSSWATSHAEGSATAPFAGTGSRTASSEPYDPDLIIGDRQDPRPNGYWYSVDWETYYQPNNLEAVTPGTALVVLYGYTSCSCSCRAAVGVRRWNQAMRATPLPIRPSSFMRCLTTIESSPDSPDDPMRR